MEFFFELNSFNFLFICRGGQNEQKDNKEKINFIDKNTSTAVVFLCLGSSFLCLSSTHRNKDKNNKES